MADPIDASCERCGTRYTFLPAESSKASRKHARVVARGLRNFVLTDWQSLDSALSLAREDQAHRDFANAATAYSRVFNFCFTCRRSVCPDCWDGETACRVCAGQATIATATELSPAAEAEAAEPDVAGSAVAEFDLAAAGAIAEPDVAEFDLAAAAAAAEPDVAGSVVAAGAIAEPDVAGSVVAAGAIAEPDVAEFDLAAAGAIAEPAEVAVAEAAVDELGLAAAAAAAEPDVAGSVVAAPLPVPAAEPVAWPRATEWLRRPPGIHGGWAGSQATTLGRVRRDPVPVMADASEFVAFVIDTPEPAEGAELDQGLVCHNCGLSNPPRTRFCHRCRLQITRWTEGHVAFEGIAAGQ